MNLKFVYGIFPVLVRYVDDLPDFAGFSYGPYVTIEKAYRSDRGLLAHELTHSRQFYRTLGLWWILYRFASLRYKYELEAYAVQLGYCDQSAADRFAGFIANRYNLTVDLADTKQDILSYKT